MTVRTITVLLTLLVAGATSGLSAAGAAERPVVSPGVTAALDAAGDRPLAIWVRFTDKGPADRTAAAALDAVAAELSPAARERRARGTLPPSLVDFADLPLSVAHLEAVARTGAEPRRRSRWLNAASYDATADQVRAIAALPGIAAVDLVGRGTGTRPALGAKPPAEVLAAAHNKTQGAYAYGASLTGLAMHGIDDLHAAGLTGRGVTVALLDTGYELEHSALRGIDILATYDFINNTPWVGRLQGEHPDQTLYGTGSLSVLAGYSPDNLVGAAPGASVILAKTENVADETPAEEDNWIAALEWAEGLGADVVASGLGYYAWYNYDALDGRTAAITVAAELAAARGVCVVSGAGDLRASSEWPHILPPADGRSVIAVGSVDVNRQVTWFSSPGPTADGRVKPDVMAFGAGHPVAVDFNPEVFNAGYGGSYGTALVAGAVALMLERNPSLSPLQVLDALRATAGRAALPDNDFGWGVVDAASAVGHVAPVISHVPLPDSEGGTGPHRVELTLTDRVGLDPERLYVSWRAAGGPWQLSPLAAEGGDIYAGLIPPQGRTGETVDYYLVATNSAGGVSHLPTTAPDRVFSFREGADTTPPEVAHHPLPDMTLAAWPPRLEVTATDNGNLASVEVLVDVPGQGSLGPFPLVPAGDNWTLDFPVAADQVFPGFTLSYVFIARDAAAVPNITTLGAYTFDVVAQKGRVLLVDDRSLGQAATADAENRASGSRPSPVAKSAADIAGWIADAGFAVDTIEATAVKSSSFHQYDVVMVSCGPNFSPFVHTDLRRAMAAWVAGGGRLVVEGGETVYAAAESPRYPDLLDGVLPVSAYGGEDAGTLWAPDARADHPLLRSPHRLELPLRVDNAGGADWSAADLAIVAPDAFIVLKALFGSGFGGVLVYDDTTGPASGQTVHLTFDITRAVDGPRLLDNVLTYLVADEGPGTGSISGRVTLAGGASPGGVTVTAGRTGAAVTAADGSYELTGLWGGDYLVEVAAPGHAPARRRIAVTDGATSSGRDFLLVPVTSAAYDAAPGITLPDNDPEGVTTAIEIAADGLVHGVEVDIDLSHFAIGQLVITLTGPDGTTVTLHNRSGGTADDIVGNWPATLFVDGPGQLADLHGIPAAGTWTLAVADRQLGALGVLNSWRLSLLVQDSSVSPVTGPVPAASRLLGAAPNPFNPRTTIAFELAAAGPARLSVYDVRGGLVRALVDSDLLPAGRHTAAWDGRDTAGAGAASGIYFVRLDTDRGRETRKMTLVR